MRKRTKVKLTDPTARMGVKVFLTASDYERLRLRVFQERTTYQDYLEEIILARLDQPPQTAEPRPITEEPFKRGVFAKAATEAAEKLGLLQADIARQAGVSATTVWNILSGTTEGRPQTREKIAKVLGIEVQPLPGRLQHKGEDDQ